ncbi:unnamed protein product, partial [Phaeothamnion confervicola]
LLELCRSCDGSETATPFYFLPVSFNGLTPIMLSESGIVRRLSALQRSLAILRLVFSEACSTASVSWAAFVSQADLSVASGELTVANNFDGTAIKALLSARGVGADVPKVFLVDEITKLERIGADAANEMRCDLCQLADELRASVIFSTLNDTTITKEHTASNREVISLPLPLLNVSEAAEVLEAALRNATIKWRL